MCEHRRRFFALGQKIYKVENEGQDFARDFYATFQHKVARWRPNDEVMTWWRRQFSGAVAGVA